MGNFVIAITRTCGSGGTTIARKLAAHYGVDMYDRKLLQLASDDSGISYELFSKADQMMCHKPLFVAAKKVYKGELIPPESNDFTSNDNLFNYQDKILKEFTKKESYVVVGRAADFVLKDYPRLIRVFIYAPHDDCVKHEMEINGYADKAEAEAQISHMNAYRSAYYEYHTGRKWFDARNYDLTLDTSKFGYDGAAEIIEHMVDSFDK